MSSRAEDLNQQTEESESMKQLKENVSAATSKISDASTSVFGAAKTGIGAALDGIGRVTKQFEDNKAKDHAAWKLQKQAEREYKAQQKAAAEAAEQAAQGGGAKGEEGADPAAAPGDSARETKSAASEDTQQEHALVVKQESAWEKFGANVRDMPLLSSFLENPLLDRMFGETEIAQSLREMKEMEPRFTLHSMVEEIEHVVAPAIIRA